MHTVFAHSVHTCTHTMCTTSTYCLSHVCAWCACPVHGVHVLCMVCTFCAWCARSVHGCSLFISTSQARFQPLYIYMYMYIEVAVCHFIIIILQLQYNVCSSVRPTEKLYLLNGNIIFVYTIYIEPLFYYTCK